MPDQTLSERLIAVLDALGIRRAHLASQTPGDIAPLAETHRDRAGGIVLLAPPRMDPASFLKCGRDVLYIAPAGGTLGRTAQTVLPRLPHAISATLEGYDAESWSDIAADRPGIARLLTDHLANSIAVDIQHGDAISGEIAGIRYQASGSGPVLVLTPLAFAPSQWQPVLPELTKRFRVVSLSGPHLGMLALLEQRAALTGWQQMCATAFDALSLKPDDHVLEVGCGSGATSRQFVQHTGKRNPLTAIDLSAYLLGEARYAAQSAGIDDAITFAHASAEELPFPANTFDAAFAITVLEECNAERALAELVRVVKPGGRVAVIVRAIDLPQWWNLALPPDIRAKVETPAASVSPDGVATAAVYQLAAAAGLIPMRLYPYIVASESVTGPVFEFPEAHALAHLTADEQAAYQVAKAEAIADGTIFLTRGHHCFVGNVTS